MTYFVIQAVVTGVSMTESIKLGTLRVGTLGLYTCMTGLNFKGKRECKVLRFPQGFPQRRAAAHASQAGGQGGGRRAQLRTEVGSGLTEAAKSGGHNLARCCAVSASASCVAWQPVS